MGSYFLHGISCWLNKGIASLGQGFDNNSCAPRALNMWSRDIQLHGLENFQNWWIKWCTLDCKLALLKERNNKWAKSFFIHVCSSRSQHLYLQIRSSMHIMCVHDQIYDEQSFWLHLMFVPYERTPTKGVFEHKRKNNGSS